MASEGLYIAAVALAVSFVLGASVGSFLNVVIYRVPRGGSVRNPKRSFCPRCETSIPWYCNVPIVSWIALRGKCLTCRAPIALQYPLVEAITAVGYAATMAILHTHGLFLVASCWLFLSCMIVVTVVSLKREPLAPGFFLLCLASAGLCLAQLPFLS